MTMPYPNVHGCRLKNPEDFQPDTFRSQTRNHEGKDYTVNMAQPKGKTTMEDQSFRYDQEIWTAAAAGTHCEDHGGSFIPAGAQGSLPQPGEEEGEGEFMIRCLGDPVMKRECPDEN